MGLIAGILDGVLCLVLYIRMCGREVPEPMGKKSAIPVALGFLAPLVSTLLLVGFGLIVNQVTGGQGQPLAGLVPTYTLKSLVAAFIGAGFPEELVKFLFLLLSMKLVKPKNVYECGLLGAGVGAGFTFLEEMLYGGGNVVNALIRLPFFAMHVVFDLIMGLFLGLALYGKKNGRSGTKKYAFLALFVPVLWHTVFDASTTFNKILTAGVDTDNDFLKYAGAAFALVVIVISVALQVWGLIQFKKRAEELCAMDISPQRSYPRHSSRQPSQADRG